jgi:hypothetical protein
MNEYDRAYYEVRGANSRELAAAAVDPKMAAIHLKTAERYDLLAMSKLDAPTGTATVQ